MKITFRDILNEKIKDILIDFFFEIVVFFNMQIQQKGAEGHLGKKIVEKIPNGTLKFKLKHNFQKTSFE